MLPHEFMRAVDFALLEKLTPDLISYHWIRQILRNTEELRESPYSDDIKLVYGLGEFTMLDLDVNPSRITTALSDDEFSWHTV